MEISTYDLEYINRYVEEVMALYEADDMDIIPQYIQDISLNILTIIQVAKNNNEYDDTPPWEEESPSSQ